MLSFNAFLFLIMICVAKGKEDYDTLCKNDYRDQKNNKIDVLGHCSNKLCIEKCCGPGEMLSPNNKCTSLTIVFNKTKEKFPTAESRYNSINVLSSKDVNKKSKKFVFVQNHRNFSDCTAEQTGAQDYEISENGSIWWQDNESKKWNEIKKFTYCIDYKLSAKPVSKTEYEYDIKIIIREMTVSPEETKEIEEFEIVVILISSFFLMLVLVVYSLLPNLRNLSGLVLMAYTFSLLFAFINKLILTFIKRDPPDGFCKKFTPVVYFGFMSSMFWLSVISFDVWRVLRSPHVKRDSKRAKLMKFMWYGLYAWGTSFLITAIVTTLDNMVYLNILEPRFKDCFVTGKAFDYYYKIPIGVLIFINTVLYGMTVYNIWVVKHAANKFQDTKFTTFAKLSVLMGLSWCLELLPAVNLLWFYILVNLYNLLIGVAIFYLFVCEKKILVQLCKKFNIRNEFVKKLEFSQRTKSGTTRSTAVASSIVKNSSEEQNQEMDRLKNCPKEESTTV